MYEMAIMADEAGAAAQAPKPRLTPAAGCFGENCKDQAARRRRSPDEIYAEWESVAHRFYLIGYRDGRKIR